MRVLFVILNAIFFSLGDGFVVAPDSKGDQSVSVLSVQCSPVIHATQALLVGSHLN